MSVMIETYLNVVVLLSHCDCLIFSKRFQHKTTAVTFIYHRGPRCRKPTPKQKL